MHAYIHTYIHIFLHQYSHYFTHISYTHMFKHKFMCVCMYIYTCVYVCINNCAFFWIHIYIDKCMCICIYVETALAMQFFKHWFWNPQTQNPRVIEQILNSRIKHTIKSWISYFQPLRSNALNSAPVLKCSMFLKIQYLTYF